MLPSIFYRKAASGFSWASTADQVTAGLSAAGLTAIVTGASSGIGAHVVMAAGNLAAADTVRRAVLAETLDVMELDLSSMASVRRFAADFVDKGLPLNISWHFLLTHLLLETMKKTSRESNVEGRIVNVSSEGHRFAYAEGIRFDKINDEALSTTSPHL